MRPGRSFAAPDPDISVCCPCVVERVVPGSLTVLVIQGWSVWLQLLCRADVFRDGFEGLAACFLAMTRPLIVRRDMIAGQGHDGAVICCVS